MLATSLRISGIYVCLCLAKSASNLIHCSCILEIIGDSESTTPLLKGNINVPIDDEEEGQKQKPHSAENSPAEGIQDKTDTVREELRDLSVLKSM